LSEEDVMLGRVRLKLRGITTFVLATFAAVRGSHVESTCDQRPPLAVRVRSGT
jgi:hypothetical protein